MKSEKRRGKKIDILMQAVLVGETKRRKKKKGNDAKQAVQYSKPHQQISRKYITYTFEHKNEDFRLCLRAQISTTTKIYNRCDNE